MRTESSDLAFPPFQEEPFEREALAVMQVLSGKSPSAELPPEVRRRVTALAQACRSGNKSKVFQLAAPLWQVLLLPERLKQAYLQVRQAGSPGNPEFQIVMDSLQEVCSSSVPPAPEMPLEEALQLLLLALTRSDKNSIYYNRLDPQLGKIRPTTFPLTEKLINSFLAPFPQQAAAARRALLIVKGQILGHPSAVIAARWQDRRNRYEQERAAFEAAQAAQKQSPPSAHPISRGHSPQWIFEQIENLLNSTADADERAAVQTSLQPEAFHQLLNAAQNQDFGQRLQRIYAQSLPASRASLLSARMATRMKRLMAEMGTWQEVTWKEFQSLMQTLGVWQGQEWLEKWRAGKAGKIQREKTGQDYLIESTHDPLAEQLAAQARMEDKRRGLKMLSAGELLPWMQSSEYKASAEERKLLGILSRPDRLDELMQQALPPEFLQTLAPELQHRVYQVFSLMADRDLDAIKHQFLHQLEGSDLEQARQLITAMEHLVQRLIPLFRRNPRLSLRQALDQIAAVDAQARERERLNSRKFQTSPAAHYHRYQQGLE